MKTKLIGIIVCMLLIFTMIPLSTTADEPIKKTITVDDGGGADYESIQDAVDHASDGDTIFVYSGTYYENVIINVSIDLIGEDKETTIVDGGGEDDVINVAAEDVTISGFKIQHCGDNWYYDGGIDIHSDNCDINNNNFVYNIQSGILIESSFNTVSENCFSNNGEGILINSAYNSINNNTINDAMFGIEVRNEYNSICNNIITDTTHAITIKSSGNHVFKNTLNNNNIGIRLYSCSNNYIYENIIDSNSYAGIDANWNTTNNLIYNNNFYNHEHAHAYDYGFEDIWNQGYPIGGNYWDNYKGEDANGDLIGDTPYNLHWEHGYDYYPLMEPFGDFRINAGYPYYSFINTPIQFNGYACGGTPPYEWFWNFGDDKISYKQNPTHTYSKIGKYTITLIVNDADGKQETMSTYAWIQDGNTKPNTPIILGPTLVKKHESYKYTFIATDPDKSSIYYYIDWDDGEIEEWIGPFPFDSGEPLTIRHWWWEEGIYVIKVKVKDVYGEESDWRTLQVTVFRNKIRTRTNPLFLRLLEQFPILQRFLTILVNKTFR